ncbi:hypothetical protein [Actinomadura graeca]|nr:hypothetical protein [Actinomadura graeca]
MVGVADDELPLDVAADPYFGVPACHDVHLYLSVVGRLCGRA